MTTTTTTATHRDCYACAGKPNPAAICLDCARAQRVLGCLQADSHPRQYCLHCAAVYTRVAACVDYEDEDPEVIAARAAEGTPQGLTSADYDHVWGCTSSIGAPASELRLIAGYFRGWRTDSGAAWPLPPALLRH
ncbi:hypothetical protein JRG18_12590 [Kocuria palustris]|uniref:hypothetical protein n=1 Tax=Kocuria palustris TaxID=71999 RepID=UPI0019D1DD33|nr:hypothetical protein [Kocuria palustris]MBN6754334.1 hypothetical protein [Kocuria palustris]MBN6759291.1 hypothetical protein [Kocuria palustris]MBN6764315.1 hypothetical protein [Kocuria palustris]MBN6783802.1 hypothetical protein [Kocuria palustris]MBN6800282.1 hypothetical protein [Kocuria palustris]